VLARILQLVDAAAGELRARWGPKAPDAVTREYGPDVGFTPDDLSTLLPGRQVYLFPAAYAAPELAARDALQKRYKVAGLVVERYTAGTGRPPVGWMDARVTFVEQVVFKPLRDPGLVLLDGVVPDLETGAEVTAVYDLDVYLKHRAFWSELLLTYQELEYL
jgi:hypothetical protein